MTRKDQNDDRFILSERGALFVSFLEEGYGADEADRLAVQSLHRAENKRGRTGVSRAFEW